MQRAAALWEKTASTSAQTTERRASQAGNVTRRSVPAELSRDSTTTAKVICPAKVATMVATATAPCSSMVKIREEIATVAAGITASETPPTSVMKERTTLRALISGGRSVDIASPADRRCGAGATSRTRWSGRRRARTGAVPQRWNRPSNR